MHMQSSVHNCVLYCANVHTAHSTMLLMHNSAHIAQCTHGNATQQCSVMDRAGADQSVKCWRERTKCYSCALNYINCKVFCRGSYIPFYVLFTKQTYSSFLFCPPLCLVAPKEIFPGQRRQSVCVWLCPGSWHRSQSSAKREHTSAQLEWGSHWIDCRSNGNIIPGPKYHYGWWHSIVFTLICWWWETTKRDLSSSSPTQFSSCGPQKRSPQIFRQNQAISFSFSRKLFSGKLMENCISTSSPIKCVRKGGYYCCCCWLWFMGFTETNITTLGRCKPCSQGHQQSSPNYYEQLNGNLGYQIICLKEIL